MSLERWGVKSAVCFCRAVKPPVIFAVCLIKTILVFTEGQNLDEMYFERWYWSKILKSLSARHHISAAGHLPCALREGLGWWWDLDFCLKSVSVLRAFGLV